MASLIPAAIGLGGSLLSSSSQKKAAKKAAAASQFAPYSTSNIFGSTQWDTKGKTLSQNLSPFAQELATSLQDRAISGLDTTMGSYGGLLRDMGANDVAAAYGAANSYGGLPQDFINQITGGYGSLMGAGAPLLGGPPQVTASGAYAPNSRGVNLRGLMQQAGNNPYAMESMNRGLGLLDANYNDVANQRLGLMRQQAAPYEEQQTNSLFQKLQQMGRLGSTPGGRDIAAFSEGLSRGDTQRQLSAMDFAQGLRAQDMGLGANLFSGGLGAMQQGQSLAANIGNSINSYGLSRDQYNLGAGQFNSELGLRAALANQGTASQYDLANQGVMSQQFGQQLAALTGLQNFGMDANNVGYSRANDRISRANDLFGFGTALKNEGLGDANNILAMLSGIAGQQNELVQQGIQAGGAQAQGGANGAKFTMSAAGSPVGGFFQGLGGGMLGSDRGQNAIFDLLGKIGGP